MGAVLCAAVLASLPRAVAAQSFELGGELLLEVGYDGEAGAVTASIRERDYNDIPGIGEIGKQLETLTIQVACAGADSGPQQPKLLANQLDTATFPFAVTSEGTCAFTVNGTIQGTTITDARFEQWLYPPGTGSDGGDGGSSVLPLALGGGAGALALAAGGVVLARRRRGAPAPAGETRYVRKRMLGEGGMKRVYLARDTVLGRDVAYAEIRTADSAIRSRVTREAQAMARLGDHPNVVTVHDTGEVDGHPFIVCQYLEGGSVSDALAGPGLGLPDAVRLAQQVASALEHAHSNGVLHRDVKPDNVWLTADGTAKLGDFGLSVALDRSRLTTQGTVLGTVAYMPPEQARGEPATDRSDVYGLGALLYEMTTGRPPFDGDTAAAIISRVLHSEPEAPSELNPGVPAELDELIVRMLAKDPEDRPASASEVRQQLERIEGRVGRSRKAKGSVSRARSRKAPAASAGSIVVVEMQAREDDTDLSRYASADGTVTMLFTDIEHASTRAGFYGDGWSEIVERQNTIVRDAARANGGFEVSSSADGFLLAFSSADRAIRCGLEVRDGSEQAFADRTPPVRLRVGIHTGEAETARFVGRHVQRAARVAEQARGGEILVSEDARRLAGDRIAFGEPRRIMLEGMTGEQTVVPVL